ncbi:MAG: PAC2 family protein [Thermoplasmatota archaeon]
MDGRWPDVDIREYRDVPLDGGTLIVSMPEFGLGSILLTDHLLESHQMQHLAAIDSFAFPPIAMVRKGKARAPVRIHADLEERIAVLWSEFAPPASLARPIARAILAWAKKHHVARILVLDHVVGSGDGEEEAPVGDGPIARRRPAVGAPQPARAPRLAFVATTDEGRRDAEVAGVSELDDAVLGGLAAVLLLEARFEAMNVLGVFAEVNSPMEQAETPVMFADVLTKIVPEVKLDRRRLREKSREVEAALRTVQENVARTLRQMQPREGASPPPSTPMYG